MKKTNLLISVLLLIYIYNTFWYIYVLLESPHLFESPLVYSIVTTCFRLTPPYMLFLMTYVSLVKIVGDGPYWPQSGLETDHCEASWWTNLLYVNNLVKTDQMV